MSHRWLTGWPLILGLVLAACGDGSGSGADQPPSPIGTLAYALTQCHDGPDGTFFQQSMQIRQGDGAPVTIMEIAPFRPGVGGLCLLFGQARAGIASVIGGGFQRLGVSPDGSFVVFEVSDDFSMLARNFLTPEQEGIFVVRADGSGLHRIGTASRNPNFRFDLATLENFLFPYFGFHPSGRDVVFTDLGPGPAGEEAVQVFTMDVRSGDRTQVTHLPVPIHTGGDPQGIDVGLATFVNERTIAFISAANAVTEDHPDGASPEGEVHTFLVDSDGSELRTTPEAAALPTGGSVDPSFTITGVGRPSDQDLPGVAENPMPADSVITELFIDDGGGNLLQLTDFRRVDTAGSFGGFLSADRQRAFFNASADPFGTNPTETCQLFSIDTLGADLRQLTHFSTGAHSASGCSTSTEGPPAGCIILYVNFGAASSQDALTGTIVFYSSCDPFGTNPNGGQLFAMNADGSELRQLTSARGLVSSGSRTVDIELPGPFAYGPYSP